MLCKEFEVTSMAVDISDMNVMFNNYTPFLGKAFQENCFMYNKDCEKIDTVLLYQADQFDWKTQAVFDHVSSLNQDSLQKGINKGNHGLISQKYHELLDLLYG